MSRQHVVRTAGALPGWPVLVMVAGLPVWWVSGLTPFVPILAALVLLGYLMMARTVRLVPGTLGLPALACWALVSTVMLDTQLRMVGFAVRWSALAVAALLLVYLTNAPARVSDHSLLIALTVVWATVVVGGFLGMLFPDGRLVTPVAGLLPATVLNNELVRDLVMPRFAEVQRPWGAPEAFVRPSAPFPYSNGWGCALALLTPSTLALRSRLSSAAGRWTLTVGMLASAVPAVATRNRGMVIILSASLLAYVIGCLRAGERRAALRAGVAGGLVVVGLGALGLFSLIAERQLYSDTTTGRTSIYQATLAEVWRSPVIGFGAPRPSEELGIALGTQGALWMVLFSYGFVGAALLLGFLISLVGRTRAQRSPWRVWLHSVPVGALVACFFYGFDWVHLSAVVIPAAILLRARYPGAGEEVARDAGGAADRPVARI